MVVILVIVGILALLAGKPLIAIILFIAAYQLNKYRTKAERRDNKAD